MGGGTFPGEMGNMETGLNERNKNRMEIMQEVERMKEVINDYTLEELQTINNTLKTTYEAAAQRRQDQNK